MYTFMTPKKSTKINILTFKMFLCCIIFVSLLLYVCFNQNFCVHLEKYYTLLYAHVHTVCTLVPANAHVYTFMWRPEVDITCLS